MQEERKRERKYRAVVGCFYCDKDIQLDNLPDHIKKQHGSHLPIKRRGDAPSLTNYFSRAEEPKKDAAESSSTSSSVVQKKMPKISLPPHPPPLPIFGVKQAMLQEAIKSVVTPCDLKEAEDKQDEQEVLIKSKESKAHPSSNRDPRVEKLRQENENFSQIFTKIRQEKDSTKILSQLDSETCRILEDFKTHAQDADPIAYDNKYREDFTFQKAMFQGLQDHFNVVVAKSDGNCFYESISLSMFGSSEYTNHFRLLQVEHLLKEQKNLTRIQKCFGKAVQEVLEITKQKPLSSNEGWASEMNIFIMTELLKRPIIVHQPSHVGAHKVGFTAFYNSDTTFSNRAPVHLVLIGQHFQPALPKRVATTFRSILGDDRVLNEYQQIEWKYKMNASSTGVHITTQQLEDLRDAQKHVYENLQIENRSKREAISYQEEMDISSFSQHELRQEDESLHKESLELDNSIREESMGSAGDMQRKNPAKESGENYEEEYRYDLEKSNEVDQDIAAVLTSLSNKIDMIGRRMDSLSLSGPQLKITTKGGSEPRKGSENISSIRMLLEQYPDLALRLNKEDVIEEDEDFTEINCELCYDPLDCRNRTGVFKYNSSRGTEFIGTSQPDAFRNLKFRVKSHMQSNAHLGFVKDKEETVRYEKKMSDRNKKTGMLLGSLAYTAIKLDRSIERYEDYVSLMSGKTDVGDINHGKDFCRSLGHSVFQSLHRKMEEHLKNPLPSTGRPTPICVLADKYTPHRITGQVVALVAFINGKITDLQFDYPVVTSHTGIDLAEAMYGSLTGMFSNEHLKTRLVGGCMDGEYIKNLGVGNHIMKNERCMNVPESNHPWYAWDWDKPHMFERAYGDANKGRIASTDSIIHTVNGIFSKSPKAFSELKSLAESSRYQKLLTPVQKSETRFLKHEYTVMTHFINNFPAMYDYLYEHQDDNANKINNVQFILRMTYKADLLNILQQVSRNSQAVGLYSWRMYDYIDSGLAEMVDMTESMDKAIENLDKNLNHFGAAIRELKEQMNESLTFRGRPLYIQRQVQTKTRSTAHETQQLNPDESSSNPIDGIVKDLKKDGENFIQAFSEGFKKRAEPNKPYTYKLVEKSFRLENILKYHENNEAAPPEFMEYFRLGQAAGYIPPDISSNDISQQYKAFSSVVADLTQEDAELHPGQLQNAPWKVESRVYNKICSTQTRKPIGDVTDLCLSAMMRAHCEAVCESMGSVVKNIKDQRNLTYENLKEELFICYNGPDPCDSDRLVHDALDLHFSKMESDKSWRFYRKTKKGSLLKHFSTSQVVDRKMKEASENVRVPYK